MYRKTTPRITFAEWRVRTRQVHNATLAAGRAIPNGLTWSNERSLLHGYPSAGRRKSPDPWNREHFSKAFKYRKGAHSAAAKPLAPTTMLLLWGRVGASGELVLEPAFVVNAPPVLPQTSGPYWLIGKDADGSELFALSFDMAASADGDGGAAFAFALPVQPEWADELERITLSGPKRAVTMDGDGPRSVAILQDSSTGRVLGILRDLDPRGPLPAARKALPESGLVTVSRGIPTPSSWIVLLPAEAPTP